MPDCVSSPANFCELLLFFVWYFDVFPFLERKTIARKIFLYKTITQESTEFVCWDAIKGFVIDLSYLAFGTYQG